MSIHTTGAAARATRAAPANDFKLEVVVVPVADVDRARRFYQGLGWRVDADFASGDDWRLVQLTPPGSACSVMFGKGFTNAEPGSLQGTFLVVDDLECARARLRELGVEVTEAFHFEGDRLTLETEGRAPGRDPKGRSYLSFASFRDPDGNSWLLQEVTGRLPGRGLGIDVPTLTAVLREAETRHAEYETIAPKHHWSEWYGAYVAARVQGESPTAAAAQAAARVESLNPRAT